LNARIDLLAGAAAVMLALGLAGAADARPLKLEDFFAWKSAGQAQISPDGRRVVYGETRVRPDKDDQDTLTYLVNADGSGRVLLLDGAQVRWSPDGTRIAYTARGDKGRQIFIKDMAHPQAPGVAVTDGKLYPGQIAWSPDGRRIAFSAGLPAPAQDFAIDLPDRPEGAKWAPDATVVDGLDYRSMTGGISRGLRHLFVVPAAGGEARDVTPGAISIGAKNSSIDWGRGFDWTPDGRFILFDGLVSRDAPLAWRRSAVLRAEVATGKVETLTRDAGFWIGPRMSPDGRHIAYFGWADSSESWPARQLRVMDADGADDRVLISDMADEPGVLQWATDSKSVYYGLPAQGTINLHQVSLNGADRALTHEQGRLHLSSFSRTGLAAAVLETPTQEGEIALVDLKTGGLSQITHVNDALAEVELRPAESFWATSRDGTRVQGWLIKPPGYDPSKRYPMILDIHGGPHSMAGGGFDFRYQDFAARGYLVVAANPRGSTGYGHEFAEAIDNAFPGDRDYQDLMAVTDWAQAHASVDPDRLYVMGCSGGGALTEWVVGHTDRFAAAVVMCPVSDWISLAGSSDARTWAQTRFAKPFWEDPKPWLEHSPLMHVGEVKTPTLVMVGDEDYRTPVSQAEEFYSALKRRGVDSKLILIKGETHQPWRGAPSNFFRVQLYALKWFESHVLPHRAPDQSRRGDR
jgi:dipeptidyl aminopeptidase/acylaminoacyl peptidase